MLSNESRLGSDVAARPKPSVAAPRQQCLAALIVGAVVIAIGAGLLPLNSLRADQAWV
jgi:hypothetical protein